MAHRAGARMAMSGYVRVLVCPDGCIRLHNAAPGYGPIVHRETRFPMDEGEAMYTRLYAAKAARREGEALLQLTKEGGGTAVWVPEADLVQTSTRLKRWKGCYGTWPVKKLNPPEEFTWGHDLGGEA